MIPILFEKDATAFTSRGLYPLSDAISCTVTEERNGEYELEMLYPITGAHFNEITEDRIIAVIPHYGGTKQAFRIYRREAELNGEVIFRARHISYQLNFIPVDIVSGQTDSAQTMMVDIAAAAQTTQPFSFWSDVTTLTPLNWDVSMPSGLRSALGGQEGSVLDRFGGEFEWDNWTVKLHESRGQDNGVKISYGKNLTELSDVLDIGETITGVMAFYQEEDENGQIVTVYSSPKVITLGQGTFAHGRIVPLDVSGEFEETPTTLDVTAYADAWLRRTASAEPVSELKVSFVPFGQTPEYSYDHDLDRVNLCDVVTVRYPALGLSVKKEITRTVWNVLSGMYDEITVGTPETTLADTIADIDSSTSGGGSSHGGGSVDLLSVYPIGSIYMSLSSVSPETLFGGVWQRITGQFLLAATDGGNSGAAQAAGNTGGEAEHTLTVNEMPAHGHGSGDTARGFWRGGATYRANVQSGSNVTSVVRSPDTSVQYFFNTASTGGGAAHNNMPPYLSVYMWQRTA